jgi:hypothetical protein
MDNTYKDCYIRQECSQLGAFCTSTTQNTFCLMMIVQINDKVCVKLFLIFGVYTLKIYLIHDLFSKLNIRKIIPETSPSFMVENQGVPGHKSIPFAQAKT